MLSRKKVFGFLICVSPLFSLSSYGKGRSIQELQDECRRLRDRDQSNGTPAMSATCGNSFHVVRHQTGEVFFGTSVSLQMDLSQKGGKYNDQMLHMTQHDNKRFCDIAEVWHLEPSAEVVVDIRTCEQMDANYIREQCAEKVQKACGSLAARLQGLVQVDESSSEDSSDFGQSAAQKQQGQTCRATKVEGAGVNTCDLYTRHENKPEVVCDAGQSSQQSSQVQQDAAR